MEKYRRAFRQKVIPRFYSGRAHILIFSTLEMFALIFLAVQLDWGIKSALYILATLVYATTFTYFLHRFFLHRKVFGLAWAHKMHHWHHTFYTSSHMQYDHLNDIYMLFMPPWIQLFYFLIYLPALTFIVQLFFPISITMHFIFGLTIWYGIYELVHWIEHLPAQSWPMKFSICRALKRHHSTHHSKLKDQANFGIVEPSLDYLFKTKY